jgi:geranylgeranyl reductase family protein
MAMDSCDVLVVGGGPAGSTCAWKLRQAGLDVMVLDAAVFPRDKVCAGWITPPVVADLRLDLDEYRQHHTLQPISGFRTGLIDGSRVVETVYDRPVSYGIRRCEFDDYLLQRSGARTRLGTHVQMIRRDGDAWIVNDAVRTPMLVGAGGHRCPVAQHVGPTPPGGPLVVAQEGEFAVGPADAVAVAPEMPELYFCSDLQGYGWCFRKQQYLNVGFGRLDPRSLPSASAAFVAFLKAARRLPAGLSWRWRGHAYLLSGPPRRRVVDAGVLLVGDAAGLARPQSGEGIRPAVESGLLAAAAIVGACGCYTRERLVAYEAQLLERFVAPRMPPFLARGGELGEKLIGRLLAMPWFARHVLLDRWFLGSRKPALLANRH